MTKSEIMKAAHAEARKFRVGKAISYAQAISVGLRRAHNDAQRAAFVAAAVLQPATPKYMWLRGW